VASDADRQALGGRELVTVARYIGQAGDAERTRPFLLKLARMVSGPGETLLLSHLATELKRPDIALVIARRATENGVTLFEAAFPVVDLGSTGSIERALALAVTRQESAFNSGAVSSSGALGLMQLMHGARRGGPHRRALHPGQADARSRLQREPGQPVPRRDAAALRRLL
jgi:soluble lytic murein transglycosylase